jgi:hypothetical protein
MMPYFRDPFCSNVFIASWTCYREADKKNLSAWIRKGAKTVIIFLTYLVKNGFMISYCERVSYVVLFRKLRTYQELIDYQL